MQFHEYYSKLASAISFPNLIIIILLSIFITNICNIYQTIRKFCIFYKNSSWFTRRAVRHCFYIAVSIVLILILYIIFTNKFLNIIYSIISLAGSIPFLSISLKIFKQHEQKVFIKLCIIEFASNISNNKDKYMENTLKKAATNTLIDYLKKLKSLYTNSLLFNLTNLEYVNYFLIKLDNYKEDNPKNDEFFECLQEISNNFEKQISYKQK